MIKLEQDYLDYFYNKVENLKAKCISTSKWPEGDYDDIEVGRVYNVEYISIRRSSSYIIIDGEEYGLGCFILCKDGKQLAYDDIIRCHQYFAPYLKDKGYMKSDMRTTTIPFVLRLIEEKYNVHILLAVESGSRAWGFESPDSDWDVRFVYVHKPEWYLGISEKRDVIEEVYYGNIDAVGWDIKKALSLFHRSNPSVMEWLHSPIIYDCNETFFNRILSLENDAFNPISTMYHYNHLYIKQDERYLQRQGFTLKRFLYYLRGILACKWIETNRTFPPVLFKDLVEATVNDDEIKKQIYDIIKKKKTSKEYDMLEVSDRLVDFAKKLADYYNDFINDFRPEKEYHSDISDLDKLMYDMIIGKQ